MISKKTIAENFSKHARDYDQHSNIQGLCASRLIKEVNPNSFKSILDIGCGTGNYTKLLASRFPQAKIKAVDISAEMIRVAREKFGQGKVKFIVADAEKLSLEEEFDLISSNASFQWFQDLESDLVKYRQALSKEGIILFSTFGPKTFFQLHSCLEEFLGKSLSLSANNFLDKEGVETILKGIFGEVGVKEEIYNQEYKTLLELLENLRCTGTRGDGLRGEIFWTSRRIASIEDIYRERFKRIVATYQVFFCRGIK